MSEPFTEAELRDHNEEPSFGAIYDAVGQALGVPLSLARLLNHAEHVDSLHMSDGTAGIVEAIGELIEATVGREKWVAFEREVTIAIKSENEVEACAEDYHPSRGAGSDDGE